MNREGERTRTKSMTIAIAFFHTVKVKYYEARRECERMRETTDSNDLYKIRLLEGSHSTVTQWNVSFDEIRHGLHARRSK